MIDELTTFLREIIKIVQYGLVNSLEMSEYPSELIYEVVELNWTTFGHSDDCEALVFHRCNTGLTKELHVP